MKTFLSSLLLVGCIATLHDKPDGSGTPEAVEPPKHHSSTLYYVGSGIGVVVVAAITAVVKHKHARVSDSD